MRVAFCFSGQPRDVKKTLDNIIWSWGSHQQLDFFVHTWIPEQTGAFRPDAPSDTFDDETLEYIIEKLNPKKHKFQQQVVFNKVYPDSKKWPVGNPWSIPNPSQNIQSFFYSVQQANNLKNNTKLKIILFMIVL